MNITLTKNRERGSLILAVFVVIIVLVVASYVIAFMRKESKIIDTKMKQQATNDDAITVPTYSNNFVYSAVTNRISAVVIADSIRPAKIVSMAVPFGRSGSNMIHPVIWVTFLSNGLYLSVSNDIGWANAHSTSFENSTADLSAAIAVEMWRSSNNVDWEDLGSMPALTNQPNMFIDMAPYPDASFYRASYSAW